jgi:hypothetical protein
MSVNPEFQSRRSSALIVVKKIGALSPKTEYITLLPEDRFGLLTQSYPQRIFSEYQMADL